MGNKEKNTIEIKNKRCHYDYELSDEEVAGISLVGSEIKSIRQGKAAIRDAYCYVEDSEMVIVGMHIAEYKQAGGYGHDPYRKRKLLLTKKQIKNFEKELKVQGVTIVPVSLFINSKGLAKIKIALGRGKRKYDKRQDIKKKDMQRDADRDLKM